MIQQIMPKQLEKIENKKEEPEAAGKKNYILFTALEDKELKKSIYIFLCVKIIICFCEKTLKQIKFIDHDGQIERKKRPSV